MKCPYFKNEDTLVIECNSYIAEAKAQQRFPRNQAKEQYIGNYCDSESWNECIYARYMNKRGEEAETP